MNRIQYSAIIPLVMLILSEFAQVFAYLQLSASWFVAGVLTQLFLFESLVSMRSSVLAKAWTSF